MVLMRMHSTFHATKTSIAPLHTSEDSDIERLKEVSRVLWQETKSSDVNGAETGDT
jgi:hypothetical protein